MVRTRGTNSPLDGQITDVETQKRTPEYNIHTSTKYIYLGFYFTLNLVLTLHNKAVLGKV